MRAIVCLSLALLCTTPASAILLSTPVRAMDLNSFRAQHGLPKLAASASLNAKAHAHAADMARRQSMDHDGFYARMAGHGAAAENVGAGCPTADCVFKMWAESSGHRANMLNTGVKYYGLASAPGGDGMTYWVLELGN